MVAPYRVAAHIVIGFVMGGVCFSVFHANLTMRSARQLEQLAVQNVSCAEVSDGRRALDVSVVPSAVAAAAPPPPPEDPEQQRRCGPRDSKIEAFRSFASTFNPTTDKVTTHQYHIMYGPFLSGMIHEPIKFLEIGLGCDMLYGPGASLRVWQKYFHPDTEIWMAETNKECVDKYKNQEVLKNVHMVTGDQNNPADLQRWVQETGGGFDVIVDDGGHTNTMIKNTFDALWPVIKPGGLYFIEDLQVGRTPPYGPLLASGFCMADVIKAWVDALLIVQAPHPHFPLPADLQSVFCEAEACVLAKKA